MPLAKIDSFNDATFYFHDLDFHLFSLLLLPKEILQLAQKQTQHLLDFIDYFSDNYPEEYKQHKFKLMMQKLIEDQINRIDLATGQLSLHLFELLKKETSLEQFFKNISSDNCILHRYLMGITDGNNGFTKKKFNQGIY